MIGVDGCDQVVGLFGGDFFCVLFELGWLCQCLCVLVWIVVVQFEYCIEYCVIVFGWQVQFQCGGQC